MPTAIVTGSGGLIGSESVRHLVDARLRRRRDRERHARALLRRRGVDGARSPSELAEAYPRRSARSSSTSATRDGVERVFAEHAGAHRARRSTPPRSRRTTGRRASPHTDFDGQCERHAQPAGGDARALPEARRSSSARPTRSTATRRTRCRCVELETRLEMPEDHRYYRRHRHVDVDRPLAPTRCSASPRPPPTCWCRSTGATSACRPSASAAAA